MSKPSQVVLLIEDEHQKMLMYRYLIESGLEAGRIRVEASPSGEGSAEAWVRKRFVKEVLAYRERSARAETRLIVVIYADNLTSQDRLNQLDEALRNSQAQAIGNNEQIARLIPRRNVETWILCLNGDAVDELVDYKHSRADWKPLIPPASRTLLAWRQSAQPPAHCVPSLRLGIAELKRLA